jgi:hypothetical protein
VRHRDIEGPIHRAILAYLRHVLPDALVHHSANELALKGADVARQIAKAKHNGMMPGWPDFEVITEAGVVFLEVKAPGGSLTEAQRGVHDAMRRLGCRVAVVRDIADTRAALAAWGIPTREARG